MSRNLARTDCNRCDGQVKLTGTPYVHKDRVILADAECTVCRAQYSAWLCDITHASSVTHRMDAHGGPFFDLSFRSSFNDEPGPTDLPPYPTPQSGAPHMTKTYTMPTFDEFRAAHHQLIGCSGTRGYFIKIGKSQLWEEDYNAIREALAVEGNRLTDARLDYLVETASNIVRKAPMWTADQNTVLFAIENLRHPELGDAEKVIPPQGDGPRYVPPESERLVGAARGEERRCPVDNTVCDCDPEDACYVSKGPNPDWRDAGGGEEKPVRTVQQLADSEVLTSKPSFGPTGPEPVADHPRCGNCKFWRLNATFSCRRYPDGSNRSATEWCGEWRAK